MLAPLKTADWRTDVLFSVEILIGFLLGFNCSSVNFYFFICLFLLFVGFSWSLLCDFLVSCDPFGQIFVYVFPSVSECSVPLAYRTILCVLCVA